jgi:hypothetical protein
MDMCNPAILLSAAAQGHAHRAPAVHDPPRRNRETASRRRSRIRHAAYARHVPDFARTLAVPEACDYDDTIVLLAESKLDGSALGTPRIQTNLSTAAAHRGIDRTAGLAAGPPPGEWTRLGVDEGRIGHVVKIALMKAFSSIGSRVAPSSPSSPAAARSTASTNSCCSRMCSSEQRWSRCAMSATSRTA